MMKWWTIYQPSIASKFLMKILLMWLKIKIYCLLNGFCKSLERLYKSNNFSVQCIKINTGNPWIPISCNLNVYRSMYFYTQQIPLRRPWTYRRCQWFWGWFWSPWVQFPTLPLLHCPCDHRHHRLWPWSQLL